MFVSRKTHRRMIQGWSDRVVELQTELNRHGAMVRNKDEALLGYAATVDELSSSRAELSNRLCNLMDDLSEALDNASQG